MVLEAAILNVKRVERWSLRKSFGVLPLQSIFSMNGYLAHESLPWWNILNGLSD